jgi:putative tRNA adenosine deaminase-associated protein
VSYFAAALVRTSSGWSGDELDLSEVEDLDGVVDLLGQAGEDDPQVSLLLFEENDEWFGIVRVDGDADPRVFVSDGRVIETSSVGAILGEAATVNDLDDDEDDDDAAGDDDDDALAGPGDPLGDADLLADLGTPASQLLELCAEEGMLPADILTAISERAGCVDTLESLREG